MCKNTDLEKLHKLLDAKIKKETGRSIIYEGGSNIPNGEYCRDYDDNGKHAIFIQAQCMKLAKAKSLINAITKAHELGHHLCWKDKDTWAVIAYNTLMEDLKPERGEMYKASKIKDILKEKDRKDIFNMENDAWNKAEEILRDLKFDCWCYFYEFRAESLNDYKYKLSLL